MGWPKIDPDDVTLCNHEWTTRGAFFPLHHICSLQKGHAEAHVCASCEWLDRPMTRSELIRNAVR